MSKTGVVPVFEHSPVQWHFSCVTTGGQTTRVVSRSIWNFFMLKALHPLLNQCRYWDLHQSWGTYPVVSGWCMEISVIKSVCIFSAGRHLNSSRRFVFFIFPPHPSSNFFKILNRVGLGTEFCSFLPESFSKLSAFQITDWVGRGVYCYTCNASILVNKYNNFGG